MLLQRESESCLFAAENCLRACCYAHTKRGLYMSALHRLKTFLLNRTRAFFQHLFNHFPIDANIWNYCRLLIITDSASWSKIIDKKGRNLSVALANFPFPLVSIYTPSKTIGVFPTSQLKLTGFCAVLLGSSAFGWQVSVLFLRSATAAAFCYFLLAHVFFRGQIPIVVAGRFNCVRGLLQ